MEGGGTQEEKRGEFLAAGPSRSRSSRPATLERKNQIFKLEGKGLRRGKRWEILASTYALLPGGFSSWKERGGEEESECTS